MSIGNLAGLRVQIGFGVDAVGGPYFVLDDPVKGVLDNVTYLLAPGTVFIDVTQYVAAVSIDRGREREIDEYKTGTATVVLNDTDRTFDPSYAAGPYYGQITPMRRIRILWNNIDLFAGWIEDWSVTYERGDKMSRVTADCADGFAILANQELSTVAASYSGDTSGVRVNRVLNRDEVEYPASRSVDAGSSHLGETVFGDNALVYLKMCARAEAGFLFVAADGTLTFRGRTAVLNSLGAVTFTDVPGVLPDDIPYRSVTQRSSADLLFTRVTGESETVGTPLESVDAAAANEYLTRTLDLGSLFTIDNNETQNLIDYHLERFSTPEERFQSAVVNVAACTEEQAESLMQLDLTDVVSVYRAPLTVGSSIQRASMIDGIKHQISPGSWEVALSFANADERSFLVLDDPVYGLLDSGNRLAF
jgi:hypothetical protein